MLYQFFYVVSKIDIFSRDGFVVRKHYWLVADNAPIKLANKGDVEEEIEEEKDMSSPIWRVFLQTQLQFTVHVPKGFREEGKIYASNTRKA